MVGLLIGSGNIQFTDNNANLSFPRFVLKLGIFW
jgi:hypothetical protein